MDRVRDILLQKSPHEGIASQQDVIMAYRLILGREPENSAAVENIISKRVQFKEMRDTFIRSAEFRHNVIGSIGGMLKPLDWDVGCIETEVDDDTLALLYAHVERVWSDLGTTEPHYSVLTNEKFKSGKFNQYAAEFFASGSSSLQVFQKTLQRNSINITQFRDCFELGCGVGRVTIKLAEIFPKIIAVDVSAPHVELARNAFVIVLQHNPPPVIGILLKKILSKLRDGGIAYFQVPTSALGYRFDSRTYLKEFMDNTNMEMHVFPQRELFQIIKEQGCRVMEVREDNLVGSRNMISNSILVIK